MSMFFASSNKVKAAEYQEYGLPFPAKPGEDIAEPMAGILYIAAYKAFKAGPGAIVEDTGLEVEDFDVGVLVRYLEDEADRFAGKRARYQVALGVNDGTEIRVYFAETTGDMTKNMSPDAYGFDGHFITDAHFEGDGRTLHEMVVAGEKAKVSPRRLVVQKFLDNQADLIITGVNMMSEMPFDTWQEDVYPLVRADLLDGKRSDLECVKRNIDFNTKPFLLTARKVDKKYDFMP